MEVKRREQVRIGRGSLARQQKHSRCAAASVAGNRQNLAQAQTASAIAKIGQQPWRQDQAKAASMPQEAGCAITKCLQCSMPLANCPLAQLPFGQPAAARFEPGRICHYQLISAALRRRVFFKVGLFKLHSCLQTEVHRVQPGCRQQIWLAIQAQAIGVGHKQHKSEKTGAATSAQFSYAQGRLLFPRHFPGGKCGKEQRIGAKTVTAYGLDKPSRENMLHSRPGLAMCRLQEQLQPGRAAKAPFSGGFAVKLLPLS